MKVDIKYLTISFVFLALPLILWAQKIAEKFSHLYPDEDFNVTNCNTLYRDFEKNLNYDVFSRENFKIGTRGYYYGLSPVNKFYGPFAIYLYIKDHRLSDNKLKKECQLYCFFSIAYHFLFLYMFIINLW